MEYNEFLDNHRVHAYMFVCLLSTEWYVAADTWTVEMTTSGCAAGTSLPWRRCGWRHFICCCPWRRLHLTTALRGDHRWVGCRGWGSVATCGAWKTETTVFRQYISPWCVDSV